MEKEFIWGAATAAYQIEGAYNEDGRGMSVWDDFSHAGRCDEKHTGDIACDHYHNFENDVKLMAELGINAYRFSISWTRILPDGIGRINQKGIDFYNNLIDCLIENNIEPYITLFHWDYPSKLEKIGGWKNPESSDWFCNFAEIVYKNFSDRVKHFITFNEPQCFLGLGYRFGDHAPGLKLPDSDTVPMAHNIMLAHGKAVKKLREIAPDCKIGYAPTTTSTIPFTNSPEDIAAAKKELFDTSVDGWSWSASWWSDPIILGSYPEETQAFKTLSKYLPETYKDDLKIISEPIDFYCQNIYCGRYSKSDGHGGYETVPNPLNTPHNSLNWCVIPEALYWGPKFLYERYKKPFYISENGMACHDTVSLDGKVHDPNRIDYIERYVTELLKAKSEGNDIRGYFYWSFMDNFEWALGYSPRFGLVYTDYEKMKRIPKDSFYWYKDFIKKNK